MKICLDCKYYSCFTKYCQHESNKTETNPVNGEYSHEWSCGSCRGGRVPIDSLCGVEAKHWTPSRWYRFRKWLGII